LVAVLLERAARAIMILIVAWFVIGTFGEQAVNLAGPILTFLAAYVIADMIWALSKHAIDRRLAEETPVDAHAGGGEGGGAGSVSRLGTLLPILRNFLMVVLVSVVLLIAFASIGIDIAPLLAGAGVAGIAIGFGAQSLVKDIFSGVFFLLDDAFRVGEYIEIEQLRGTVEHISIRSMRLRHHRGAVHTIPFGEIRSITNYSRDWVIMKLEFNVPFDTDVALVKRLVKQLGKELMDDPMVGPGILEPLKSQGVRRVEEFNMVIGVKFMTKPGEQWVARREIYQRILERFKENGIRLASRDVQVQVPTGASEEERQKAAMAATQIATERTVPGGGQTA
jgi:small-conductance mechanosensitive channel